LGKKGAQECGISPDELSSSELLELGRFVLREMGNVPGLQTDIIRKLKSQIKVN